MTPRARLAVKRARPSAKEFFWNRKVFEKVSTPDFWYVASTPPSSANSSSTSSKIQREASYYQQLTTSGSNISLERLSLHETILVFSVYYRWPNELSFQKTVELIFQEKVKPFIAANLQSASAELEVTSLLRKMLLSDELKKFYKLVPITFKTNEDRRTILVVGGGASGKSRISDAQYKLFECDMLMLNPDIYKPILISISNSANGYSDGIHAEGSILFSKIMRYWASLADASSAPHVLMDVARAWQWLREKGSSGNTQLEAHSPILSIEEALKRSYARGLQTARFMPTDLLIQTHKDQVSINLEAMRAGCDFTFYDASVNLDQALPVVAKFSAKEKCLEIFKFSVMLDYFQKENLCVTSINKNGLFAHSPQSTVQSILKYADHMLINLYAEQDKKIASLHKEGNSSYVFIVTSVNEFEEALGADAKDFVQGLIENNVRVSESSSRLSFRL